MKKLLIVALMTGALMADGICDTMATFARTVMMKRQEGVSVRQMMHIVEDVDDKAIRKSMEAIIVDAFKRPRYYTDEVKQREIDEFENVWYLGCKMVFEEE